MKHNSAICIAALFVLRFGNELEVSAAPADDDDTKTASSYNNNTVHVSRNQSSSDDSFTDAVVSVAKLAVPAVKDAVVNYFAPAVDKEAQALINKTHLEPIYRSINDTKKELEAEIDDVNSTLIKTEGDVKALETEGEYFRTKMLLVLEDLPGIHVKLDNVSAKLERMSLAMDEQWNYTSNSLWNLQEATRVIIVEQGIMNTTIGTINTNIENMNTTIGTINTNIENMNTTIGTNIANMTTNIGVILKWIEKHNNTFESAQSLKYKPPAVAIVENAIKAFDSKERRAQDHESEG